MEKEKIDRIKTPPIKKASSATSKKPAIKVDSTLSKKSTTAKNEVTPPINQEILKKLKETKKNTTKQSEDEKTKLKGLKSIIETKVEGTKNKNEDKLKVLYVVSECQPFIANGGLADVAGSLPKSIANKDKTIDIRVVMPLYGDIKESYKNQFKFVSNFTVHLGWRQIYAGVFEYKLNNVTYYFIDNENYFKRKGTYGHFDDGERFAYFSKAVVEMLPVLDFLPDVIHCNDWHTALVSIYIKTSYYNDNRYNKIKHLFTIHNIEYQGKYGKELIETLFGIDKKYLPDLEYYNDINLLKCAIQYADIFTTVSHSYSKELKSPDVSYGLHNIINMHQNKLVGIMNGIDYDFYNPMTDKIIYKNYSIETSEFKKENKKMLQQEIGLPVDENIPMICIASRLVKHKGFDIIETIFEEMIAENIQFVIVGDGDKNYIDFFKTMEYKYPEKVKAFVGIYSNEWARKFYAASDALLMPSLNEPCGLSQMVGSRYGAVPIVREIGGLKDSIRDFGCEGGGNGFTFTNYNPADLLYSIRRMLHEYEKHEEWLKFVKVVMNIDFSWDNSTKEYIKLYKSLV